MSTTNITDTLAERRLAEEILRLKRTELKNGKENSSPAEAEGGQDLVLAPLVDKIAYGIARGLVVAMKELENHIASETRKVGDSVGQRLDAVQASIKDLNDAVSEQRTFSQSVNEKVQQLAAQTESLKETDARQDAELASTRASLKETDTRQQAELANARAEAKELSSQLSSRVDALVQELNLQQEDLTAVKTTLGNFSSTVEALVTRLDRQADALRSMCAAYTQRETELEQLVDGLARLRSYPAPPPMPSL